MKDWKNHRPRDPERPLWALGTVLVLALALLLALVDRRERQLEADLYAAETKLAAARAEAARWQCTEFTGRWPVEGARAKACVTRTAELTR